MVPEWWSAERRSTREQQVVMSMLAATTAGKPIHKSQTLHDVNMLTTQSQVIAKKADLEQAIAEPVDAVALERIAQILGLSLPARTFMFAFIQNQIADLRSLVEHALRHNQGLVFAWHRVSAQGPGFFYPDAIDKHASVIPVMLYSADVHPGSAGPPAHELEGLPVLDDAGIEQFRESFEAYDVDRTADGRGNEQ
jgi:hypothetical protein